MDRYASSRALWVIAPYVGWMVLLLTCGGAPVAYAWRTLAAAVLLLVAWRRCGLKVPRPSAKALGWGVVFGLVVLALWVGPERWEFYRRYLTLGNAAAGPSPLDPAECGWALTWVRLLGSAFVIAPAEELFFRFFLYRWIAGGSTWLKPEARRFDLSAFLWTVGLFAAEHDRWAAALAAGVVYGLLSLRWGLWSAIVAHVVTNLTLGLYVLATGAWQYW